MHKRIRTPKVTIIHSVFQMFSRAAASIQAVTARPRDARSFAHFVFELVLSHTSTLKH